MDLQKLRCGCGVDFLSIEELAEHNEQGTCLYCSCGQSFSHKKHLQRHRKTVHGPNQCKFCGEELPTRHQLLLHTNRMHTPEKKIVCPTCGKDFASGYHLRRHMQRVHSEETTLTDIDTESASCSQSEPDQAVKSSVETVSVETASVEAIDLTHSISYSCDVCSMAFQSKRTLHAHQRVHSNVFHCKTCKQVFPTNNELVSHTKMEHDAGDGADSDIDKLVMKNTEHQYQASPSCSAFEGSANVHLKQHKGDGKPPDPTNSEPNAYTDIELSTASMLVDMHFLTDTNEDKNEESVQPDQPAVSDVESNSLTVESATGTMKHIANDNITCTVSHICPVCNRGFRSKYNLVVHSQSHVRTEFQCNFCIKMFRRRKMLTKHVQMEHSDLNVRSREYLILHNLMPDELPQCRVLVKSLKMGDLPHNVQIFLSDVGKSDSIQNSANECTDNLTEDCHSDTKMVPDDSGARILEKNSSSASPVDVVNDHQEDGNGHMCHICNKILCNKSYLRKHIAAHSDADRCRECFKLFKSKCQLYEHLSTVHSTGDTYSYYVDEVNIEGNSSSCGNKTDNDMSKTNTNHCPTFRAEYQYGVSDIAADSHHSNVKEGLKENDLVGDNLNQNVEVVENKSSFLTHGDDMDIYTEIPLPLYEIQMANVDFNDSGSPAGSDQLDDDEKGTTGHVCQICEKVLCSKSYLKKHVAMHSNMSDDRCRICFKVFRPKSRLYAHLVSEHNIRDCDTQSASILTEEIDQVEDQVSGGETIFGDNSLNDNSSSTVNSETVKSNDVQNNGPDNLCHICNKILSTKTYLKKHIAMHSEVDRCKMCFKVFRPKSRLYAHLATEHNIKECDPFFDASGDVHPIIPSKSPKYLKDLPSDPQMSTERSLNRAAEDTSIISEPLSHFNLSNSSKGLEISAEVLGMSPEYLPIKSAPLTSLMTDFSSSHDVSHIAASPVKPNPEVLPVDSVELSPTSSSQMKIYDRETLELMYTSVGFVDVQNPSSDDNIDLGGEDNHKCDVCCRVFRSKYNLIAHARIHSLDKCPHCSKVYSKKKALAKHIKKVHCTDNPQCTLIVETLSTPLEVGAVEVHFEPTNINEGQRNHQSSNDATQIRCVEQYPKNNSQNDSTCDDEPFVETNQFDDEHYSITDQNEGVVPEKVTDNDIKKLNNADDQRDSMSNDNLMINVDANNHDVNMSGIHVLGSDIVIDTVDNRIEEENQVVVYESRIVDVTSSDEREKDKIDNSDDTSSTKLLPADPNNDDDKEENEVQESGTTTSVDNSEDTERFLDNTHHITRKLIGTSIDNWNKECIPISNQETVYFEDDSKHVGSKTDNDVQARQDLKNGVNNEEIKCNLDGHYMEQHLEIIQDEDNAPNRETLALKSEESEESSVKSDAQLEEKSLEMKNDKRDENEGCNDIGHHLKEQLSLTTDNYKGMELLNQENMNEMSNASNVICSDDNQQMDVVISDGGDTVEKNIEYLNLERVDSSDQDRIFTGCHYIEQSQPIVDSEEGSEPPKQVSTLLKIGINDRNQSCSDNDDQLVEEHPMTICSKESKELCNKEIAILKNDKNDFSDNIDKHLIGKRSLLISNEKYEMSGVSGDDGTCHYVDLIENISNVEGGERKEKDQVPECAVIGDSYKGFDTHDCFDDSVVAGIPCINENLENGPFNVNDDASKIQGDETDKGKDSFLTEDNLDSCVLIIEVGNDGSENKSAVANQILATARRCFVLVEPLNLRDVNAKVRTFSDIDVQVNRSSNESVVGHHMKDSFAKKWCVGPNSQHTIANPDQRSVSTKLEYKCDLCCKLFRTKRGLIRHSRIPNCINFKVCTMCDKEFPRTSALERHMKVDHGVKKTGKVNSKYLYICEICGMQVKTKRSLSGHMALHSRRNTCRCTVCRRTFDDIVELEKHILSLHGIGMKTQGSENCPSPVENISLECKTPSRSKSLDTEHVIADTFVYDKISSGDDAVCHGFEPSRYDNNCDLGSTETDGCNTTDHQVQNPKKAVCDNNLHLSSDIMGSNVAIDPVCEVSVGETKNTDMLHILIEEQSDVRRTLSDCQPAKSIVTAQGSDITEYPSLESSPKFIENNELKNITGIHIVEKEVLNDKTLIERSVVVDTPDQGEKAENNAECLVDESLEVNVMVNEEVNIHQKTKVENKLIQKRSDETSGLIASDSDQTSIAKIQNKSSLLASKRDNDLADSSQWDINFVNDTQTSSTGGDVIMDSHEDGDVINEIVPVKDDPCLPRCEEAQIFVDNENLGTKSTENMEYKINEDNEVKMIPTLAALDELVHIPTNGNVNQLAILHSIESEEHSHDSRSISEKNINVTSVLNGASDIHDRAQTHAGSESHSQSRFSSTDSIKMKGSHDCFDKTNKNYIEKADFVPDGNLYVQTGVENEKKITSSDSGTIIKGRQVLTGDPRDPQNNEADQQTDVEHREVKDDGPMFQRTDQNVPPMDSQPGSMYITNDGLESESVKDFAGSLVNDADAEDSIQDDISALDVPSTSKRFNCSLCDKSYKHNGDLKRHVQGRHENVSFPCSLCEKRFFRKDRLKYHVKNKHKSVCVLGELDSGSDKDCQNRTIKSDGTDSSTVSLIPVVPPDSDVGKSVSHEFSCSENFISADTLTQDIMETDNTDIGCPSMDENRMVCESDADDISKFPNELLFNKNNEENVDIGINPEVGDSLHLNQSQLDEDVYDTFENSDIHELGKENNQMEKKNNSVFNVDDDYNDDGDDGGLVAPNTSVQDASCAWDKFTCGFCERSYKYVKGLNRHMKDKHNGSNFTTRSDQIKELGESHKILPGASDIHAKSDGIKSAGEANSEQNFLGNENNVKHYAGSMGLGAECRFAERSTSKVHGSVTDDRDLEVQHKSLPMTSDMLRDSEIKSVNSSDRLVDEDRNVHLTGPNGMDAVESLEPSKHGDDPEVVHRIFSKDLLQDISVGTKDYACWLCDRSGLSKRGLAIHLSRVHKEYQSISPRNNEDTDLSKGLMLIGSGTNNCLSNDKMLKSAGVKRKQCDVNQRGTVKQSRPTYPRDLSISVRTRFFDDIEVAQEFMSRFPTCKIILNPLFIQKFVEKNTDLGMEGLLRLCNETVDGNGNKLRALCTVPSSQSEKTCHIASPQYEFSISCELPMNSKTSPDREDASPNIVRSEMSKVINTSMPLDPVVNTLPNFSTTHNFGVETDPPDKKAPEGMTAVTYAMEPSTGVVDGISAKPATEIEVNHQDQLLKGENSEFLGSDNVVSVPVHLDEATIEVAMKDKDLPKLEMLSKVKTITSYEAINVAADPLPSELDNNDGTVMENFFTELETPTDITSETTDGSFCEPCILQRDKSHAETLVLGLKTVHKITAQIATEPTGQSDMPENTTNESNDKAEADPVPDLDYDEIPVSENSFTESETTTGITSKMVGGQSFDDIVAADPVPSELDKDEIPVSENSTAELETVTDITSETTVSLVSEPSILQKDKSPAEKLVVPVKNVHKTADQVSGSGILKRTTNESIDNKVPADPLPPELDNEEVPVSENLSTELETTTDIPSEKVRDFVCGPCVYQRDKSQSEDLVLGLKTVHKTADQMATDPIFESGMPEIDVVASKTKSMPKPCSADQVSCGTSESCELSMVKNIELAGRENLDLVKGPDELTNNISVDSIQSLKAENVVTTQKNELLGETVSNSLKLENNVPDSKATLPKFCELANQVGANPVIEPAKLETFDSSITEDLLGELKNNEPVKTLFELSKSLEQEKAIEANSLNQEKLDGKPLQSASLVTEAGPIDQPERESKPESAVDLMLSRMHDIKANCSSKTHDSADVASDLDSSMSDIPDGEVSSIYPEYYSDSESSLVGYYGHSEVESYSCDESSNERHSEDEFLDDESMSVDNAVAKQNSRSNSTEIGCKDVVPTSLSIDGVCGQVYKCNICSMYLSSKRSLARHSKIHVDELIEDKVKSSLSSDATAIDNDKLSPIKHSAEEEGETIPDCDSSVCSATEELNSTDSSGYSVEDRVSTDSSFDDIEGGLEHASEPRLSIGAPVASSELLDESMNRDSFRCHLCSKTCSSKGNLARHVKSHMRRGRRKCAMCEKQYRDDGGLKKHMRDVHRVEYHSYSSIDEVLGLTTNEQPELINRRCSKSRKRKLLSCPPVSRPRVYRKRHHDNTYVGSVTTSPTIKRTTRQDTLVYRTRANAASQPRECEMCAEVFPNRTSLSDHSVCFIKH